MDELIRRQAMKNMITNHWSDFSNAINYRTALACVDAVPTFTPTQPEPHWIPVTERLPNRDELVLVTYKITGRIHLCKYLDDGSENSWWSYINDSCAWNNMILAWMPLPEPYNEVTE